MIGTGLGDYGGYRWDRLSPQCILVIVNILAVWLLTAPGNPLTAGRLRAWVRWLTVVSVGAAAGWVMASKPNYAGYDLAENHSRSHVFAVATLFCELPPTLLLYAFLAGCARRGGSHGLTRSFLLLGVGICVLAGAGLGMFALARPLYAVRASLPALAMGAVYGAVAIAIATWASAAVIALAVSVLRPRRADNNAAPLNSGAATAS